MVHTPNVYLLTAGALAALNLQQAAASSLEFDPFTTCNSYNIGDENFPGRGSEIEDDGNCVVTVPEDPNKPKPTEHARGRRLEGYSRNGIATLENHFGKAMERKLKNLPTTAVHSPSPWPGPAWPTFRDSINFEWSKGQPSAAEKYAKAFGLDVVSFMDGVSAQNGIDSRNDFVECTSDNQCVDSAENAVCAIRANKTAGYCIPTWFAIDHAWVAAATLEQEPSCPVTFNGVTFQPMDLKALITDVYDDANTSSTFTGSRYNGYNDSIDAYGRHTDYSYRDLNPGFFHVAAANLLGLLNTPFIIDQVAGYGVWNQPVVGFKVHEQTAMSTEEAASKFYGLESYPWNENATSIVFVKSHLSWIEQSETDGGLIASGLIANFTGGAFYDYLLEIDNSEEIIGGEWLYDSNDNHPDFLWLLEGKPPADTVTTSGLSYANVTMLLEKAVLCSGTA